MVKARDKIDPFLGYNHWVPEQPNGGRKTVVKCDMDYSGTKTYSFNRQGFRGEDFDPKASKRIFFSGCSYTFGTGLNYEETAAYKFKMNYCSESGIDPAEVNLLNFAMPGGSNDYIVRTMISQCEKVKPDIAVVLFSHSTRAEYIDEEALGNKVATVAPWWVEHEPYQHLTLAEKDNSGYIQVIRNASLGYLHYSTPANELAAFLRNALLIQYYLSANNIPFILHWADYNRFGYAEKHFALKPLTALLKKQHFINYSDPEKYWCDKAADDTHPGPVSNTNIANA